MKNAILPLLILLVSILAVAALGAAQGDATATRTNERGRNSSAAPTRDADPASTKGASEGRRAGGFNQSGTDLDGRYVSFQVDLPACRITEFAVYGTPVFTEIRLSASDCEIAKGNARGRLELESGDAQLRLHDAPNGLISANVNESQSVQFVLAAGVTVEGEGSALQLRVGNLSARVFGPRSADETAVRVESARITAQGVGVDVMFHPLAGNTEQRRAILDAIAKGRVGAQVDVLAGADGAESEVFAFDDMEIRVRQPGKDRFDFTVAANLTEGRVVVTNFDPAAWDPARLRVDYADVREDGSRRPVHIRAADDLDSVLNFTNGGDALYYVYEDMEGRHVAVAIPEWSVHAFEVVGLPLQVVPLLMYGVVIVGLFFATGGVGVVLERRARRQGR